jgi:hypothetical protein
MSWTLDSPPVSERVTLVVLVDQFAASAAVVRSVLDCLARHEVVLDTESIVHVETGARVTFRHAPETLDAFAMAPIPSASPTDPLPRATGITSLRWQRRSVLALFDCDELRVRPIATEWRWGNTIVVAMPLLGLHQSARDTTALAKLLADLGDTTGALYGYAHVDAEWNARHIRVTKDSIESVGLDVRSQPLPMFWLNYLSIDRLRAIGLIDAIQPLEMTALTTDVGLVLRTRERPDDWLSASKAIDRLETPFFDFQRTPGAFARMLGIEDIS